MSAKFVRLWLQLTPGIIETKKVNDVCLENKVEQFKIDVSKLIQVPDKSLELIYCGIILEDELSLNSYGIKAGSTVHVLKKKEKDPPCPPRVLSKEEIQEIANAYKSFSRNHRLRSALFRLTRPEILENIVAAIPGLREDTAAMGILRDPQLLLTLSNPDVVKRTSKTRPLLIEAANHIAAAVHEEASNTPSTSANTSGYSYSLDALSDDEDMDSSQNRNFQSSDSLSRSDSTSRQRSFTAITASQLAAALANASGGAFSNSSSANTSVAGPSSSNSLITPEMFTQAIEQAIASVGSDRTLNTSLSNDSDVNMGNGSENTSQSESEPSSLASQMTQMRELGFTDIAVNLQALQASGGDLQAAVNLILSGAMSPEGSHD